MTIWYLQEKQYLAEGDYEKMEVCYQKASDLMPGQSGCILPEGTFLQPETAVW